MPVNPTTEIVSSNNPEWGFWGTMAEQAKPAWPLAMTAISEATGQPLQVVREFLDSSYGRHFADSVLNHGGSLLDAIRCATSEWMARKVGWRISLHYGIPIGLPHLTGFVALCDME